MTIYIFLILNICLFFALFFIFRQYIRRELRRAEYVRQVETELQQLLLDIHRSAEDITLVIEDRTQQFRKLFTQVESRQETAARQAESQQLRELQQQTQAALAVKQELEKCQLKVQNWQDQQHQEREEFYSSLSAKLERDLLQILRHQLYKELHQKLRLELWQGLLPQIQQIIETKMAEELAPKIIQEIARELEEHATKSSPVIGQTGTDILDARLRAEIEHYIKLGMAAPIISQKTGVPLNLVEIMVSMKGNV